MNLESTVPLWQGLPLGRYVLLSTKIVNNTLTYCSEEVEINYDYRNAATMNNPNCLTVSAVIYLRITLNNCYLLCTICTHVIFLYYRVT